MVTFRVISALTAPLPGRRRLAALFTLTSFYISAANCSYNINNLGLSRFSLPSSLKEPQGFRFEKCYSVS